MLDDDDYLYTIAVNHDYSKREMYIAMFRSKKHLDKSFVHDGQDDDEVEMVSCDAVTHASFADMTESQFMDHYYNVFSPSVHQQMELDDGKQLH